MSRKLTVLFLTAALSLSVFAGGQKEAGKDEAPQAAEEVTIQIAFPVAVDAPLTAMFDEYAKEFMAANPNVTVETIYAGGYGDVKTMVQTTIDGGGDAPSLAILLATDVYDLANAQYVVPMTDYAQGMVEDFLPAFMANSYYGGDLWSLPFQRSAVVVYYNADMIKEAGLDVPSNWKEFAETAQALTLAGGERWGVEWPSGWPYWLFQPLALGAGGNIVGEGDTEVTFDSPAVIDAIEYYINLSKKYGATPAGVQGSWGNVVPNFVSGNTAMIVHSSGSLSKVLAQADFEVGVMGIPGKKGGNFTVPGGGNIYMIAGMDEAEKKAAFQFAAFLTEPARAAAFSIKTGYIATSNKAWDDEAMKAYAAGNPQVGQIHDALATAGKELSVQNLGEVRTIFHKYLQAAYNGEMSPAAAMAKAQEEADKALADFR